MQNSKKRQVGSPNEWPARCMNGAQGNFTRILGQQAREEGAATHATRHQGRRHLQRAPRFQTLEETATHHSNAGSKHAAQRPMRARGHHIALRHSSIACRAPEGPNSEIQKCSPICSPCTVKITAHSAAASQSRVVIAQRPRMTVWKSPSFHLAVYSIHCVWLQPNCVDACTTQHSQ